MRRRLLIALLTFGTIGGFACGFAHMGRNCRAHQAAYERHVADLCVNAAKNGPRAAAPAEEAPPW